MLDPSCRDGCGISVMLCFSVSLRSAVMAVSLLVGCPWNWLVSGAGWLSVELVEGAAEDQLGELAVPGHGPQPGVLAGLVTPGLVAGEQEPGVARAALADLVHQPARGEADGPGQVGVDALARRHPVEEPAGGQLDVPADAAAVVHQVH